MTYLPALSLSHWLRARNTLFFIAALALWTGVNAQNAQLVLNTAQQSNPAVVQTAQVRAELLAHAPDGVGRGKTVWLGLQLAHQPHWHTYWRNPGDSGLPTTLQWQLPAGITAGDIAWPLPQRIPIGNLANYGYEGTVLLPVPLTIAPDFQAPPSGVLDVRLAASWLVCQQECIPQDGNFVLHLPVQGSTALHAADFEAARAATPQELAGATATVTATVAGEGGLKLVVQGLPANWHGRALQSFPETVNIADPVRAPQSVDAVSASTNTTALQAGTQVWREGVWSAMLPLSVQRETTVEQLPVVLALGAQGVRVVATVSGTWPALEQPPHPGVVAAPPVSIAPPVRPADGMAAWWVALAAALLGGLILNLMPCVLPVLAIKVLGFTSHGREQLASHRLQGLAYTLGVMLSFIGLGALLLALRAGGEQLGWGFQLQSPAVVAALAVLFTLLGLNLAGLFEMGNILPHRLAALQSRHPVVDSFLSGVLAVAVASPCSAPFMGASLGYAVSQPAGLALGIFAAMGLGLALPFLLASWLPGVGNWLPRPGIWMDTLRRFLAFPMFATVIWLVWVLGHLSGVDGAGALLALLLALGLLIWSLGLSGRSRVVFAVISIAVLALLTGAIGPLVLKMDTPGTTVAADGDWQAWSPERVQTELRAGRPVFVDFTAAWCITCQFNKKTTLSRSDVLADFHARRVALLRADWTRRDPAITRALEELGRSGVPVYVLYHNGRAPLVFSEILDAQELRASLAQL
ncbi:MAG: thioredoxin family protein [Rhodoferax sp.]|nr:thioredoxin family protein [Rhodoferax sp.]